MTVQQENMTPFYTIDNIGNTQVGRPIQPSLPLPQPAAAPPFPQHNNYPLPPAPVRPNLLSQTGMQGLPMGCNFPGGNCTGGCLSSRQASGPFNALPRSFPNPPASSSLNFNPQPTFLQSNRSIDHPGPLSQQQVHSISPPLQGSAFGNHQSIHDSRLGHNQFQYETLGMKPTPLNQVPSYVTTHSNGMNPMLPNMARSDSLDFFNQMPQSHPSQPASFVPPPIRMPPVMRNPMLDFGNTNNAVIPYNQAQPRPIPMAPPMILPAPTNLPPLPAPAPPALAPSKANEDSELAKALGFLDIGGDVTPPATTMTSKSLRDVHNDLGPLAREISPTTKPFDTTGTIITTVVQNLGLPYPHEWRATLRTHSCMVPSST
jgi:hypothetical protein